MKYGGDNDIIKGICPRCGKSPDTHKPLPYIQSDTKSDRLVEQLNTKMSNMSLRLMKLHRTPLRGTWMLGSAVATIGSKTVKYVTISGATVRNTKPVTKHGVKRPDKFTYDTPVLKAIGSLGSDVELIEQRNCSRLPHYMVVAGHKTRGSPTVGPVPGHTVEEEEVTTHTRVYRLEWNIGGREVPVIVNDQGRDRDYTVGNCAGQKLVTHVLSQAAAEGKRITAFMMSEMYWRDFQSDRGGRQWSTLSSNESCDTCKQVIPQLLCSEDPCDAFKTAVRQQENGLQ